MPNEGTNSNSGKRMKIIMYFMMLEIKSKQECGCSMGIFISQCSSSTVIPHFTHNYWNLSSSLTHVCFSLNILSTACMGFCYISFKLGCIIVIYRLLYSKISPNKLLPGRIDLCSNITHLITRIFYISGADTLYYILIWYEIRHLIKTVISLSLPIWLFNLKSNSGEDKKWEDYTSRNDVLWLSFGSLNSPLWCSVLKGVWTID